MITYTSIVGGRDKLRPQPASKYPYKAFVDDINLSMVPWQLYKATDTFIDPCRNAKQHKILPHLYLDTKVSLWLDGNVELKKPPEDLLVFLEKYDVVMMANNLDCVFDEAEHIKNQRYEDSAIVDEQTSYLHARGVTKNYGTLAPRIMLRKHNQRTQEFMERWWAEICRGSRRDILTVRYAARGLPVKIGLFPFHTNVDNEWIRVHDHL